MSHHFEIQFWIIVTFFYYFPDFTFQSCTDIGNLLRLKSLMANNHMESRSNDD